MPRTRRKLSTGDTLIHSLIDPDLTHNWFNNYLNVEDKKLFEKLGLGLGLGLAVLGIFAKRFQSQNSQK